jgi:hypothetical protein
LDPGFHVPLLLQGAQPQPAASSRKSGDVGL